VQTPPRAPAPLTNFATSTGAESVDANRCRSPYTHLACKGETQARHHRPICSELESIARGDVQRLTVLTPPGSANMAYVSRLFPAWHLTVDHVYLIPLSTKLFRPVEHRIDCVTSMKPGPGTRLIVLK